jgi:hypothetical protein
VTGLEFYTDAILSSRVLDVGPGSAANEVEQALGPVYIDDARKKTMRRDYGLVEAHFSRQENSWICFGLTIQVHRLAESSAEIVPAPLRESYGQFDRFLDSRRLMKAVEERHGRWIAADDQSPQEFQTLWVASTQSVIHVVCNRARHRNGQPGFEDVWSIELRSGGRGDGAA